MDRNFPEIRGALGFGCMRLPMADKRVDLEQFSQMVDEFLAGGFNYFDTAHGYLEGESERALRAGLTSRYPRERYVLTDKLSGNFFERREDIRPLFESQLAACGVDYFDFYLMHAQGDRSYPKFTACRAYETALELKAEGKFRHFGISFHGTPRMLDKILTERPQIEMVLLQINYLDWEDPSVQSRGCYEVCQRHGKPVAVMEPVKGGRLAELSPQAQEELDALPGDQSNAGYALRFAAGLESVAVTLSGMSSLAQLRDNMAVMAHPAPLTGEERGALERAARLLRAQDLIPCTDCKYCLEGCPMGIAIPGLFACLNDKKRGRDREAEERYGQLLAGAERMAGTCVKCGKCEAVCPQHLHIRDLLVNVARAFEG